MKNILIAYFSHSGNIRNLAEQIREILAGEIYEIQPVDPYPGEYNACVEQAKREVAQGYKPELKGDPIDISQYEVVFIGSPVWWYTVAPPVASFLSENDFSGKNIAPFCTHEGSGLSKCATDIARMCPKATVLEGAAFRGSRSGNVGKELTNWIERIKVR